MWKMFRRVFRRHTRRNPTAGVKFRFAIDSTDRMLEQFYARIAIDARLELRRSTRIGLEGINGSAGKHVDKHCGSAAVMSANIEHHGRNGANQFPQCIDFKRAGAERRQCQITAHCFEPLANVSTTLWSGARPARSRSIMAV